MVSLGVLRSRKTVLNYVHPVHSVSYRARQTAKQFATNEIHIMLQEEVIEPATTKWAGPFVFAPKKDGSLRFCVDYWKLNSVAIHDLYPLPRMDGCFDALGEACIFFNLDANSGYWQVKTDDWNRETTALKRHHGLYHAQATLQTAMDVKLSSVKLQSALVYLDDIVFFLETCL